MISDEIAEKTAPKFSRLTEESKSEILPISPGSIAQLKELVTLIANKKVIFAFLKK